MHKSKFIEIIRTLTPDEFRQFRSFVRSPFHNSNKKVIEVVEIVKKCFDEYDSPKLEKEKVFKRIYPGKKYNDTVMRILLSDLLKLAEEFLVNTALKASPSDEMKLLLSELDMRKLHSLFDRNLKIAFSRLSEPGIINMDYYNSLYSIQSKKIDNMISRGKQPQSAEDVLLQGEYLINFFLISFINIAHELAVHEEVLNVRFEKNTISDLLENFDIGSFIETLHSKNYENAKVLKIYYGLYALYLNPGEDYSFKNIENLMLENLDLFTREEKFNLFIVLESILTSRNAYEDLFKMYNLMIIKNILTHKESDYIQLNFFRNIFYTGIMLKEFDWTERFILENLEKLDPSQRENTKHLAFAYLYFGKKDYEKALTEINRVSYEYFAIKIDVRMLTLKIYYELDSFEPALSLIDTFAHYLANSKSVSSAYKTSFTNFLKFLKVLIKFRTGMITEYEGNLKDEILSARELSGKAWLIEKTESIFG